jgi:hypothetical protein
MKIIQKVSLLILICAFTCIGYANENTSGEKILAQFNTLTVASGHFIQRKYFTVLKHPILSKGEVYLEKDRGLVWQTNSPVFSRLLLKNNELYSDDGRNPIKKIKGGDTLAKVIMHAILGDISALKQQFTISNSNKQHCAELTPKDSQLSNVMRLIELCGSISSENDKLSSNVIEHIVLFEQSGNRTEIALKLTPQSSLPEVVRAQLN